MEPLKKKILSVIICAVMISATTACTNDNKNKFYGDSEAKTDIGASDESVADISKEYSLDIPEYNDYFKLGNYKNIEYYIDDDSYKANENTINRMVLSNLEIEPKEVSDRPVKKGDYVNVTFNGTINGKEFEGCSAENIELVIGEYKLLAEFENSLVGLKNKSTDEIEYTFPDDYSNKDIAGKTAVFNVTVNSIKDYSIDLVTDEIVSEKTDYKTLDEYKENLVKEIEIGLADQKRIDSASIIMSKILENSEIIGYDEEEIDEMIKNAKFTTDMYAKEAGVTAEEYVINEYGYKSYNEYTDGLEKSAQEYLNTIMVMSAIAHAENLTVTDEEYQNQINDYLTKYNVTAEQLSEYYRDEDIVYSIIVTKVYDCLLDNSIKLDKPASE